MSRKKNAYFRLWPEKILLVKSITDFQQRYIKYLALMGMILAIAGLLAFSGCKKEKPEAKGFNLLVITLDTTRADRLGAYGYKPAQTPNLDALAQEGVMFEQCYTPVPLTLAAHCTIFSGQFPVAHHVRGNGIYLLNQETETLAEQMKKNNYQTFAVIGAYVLLGKFGLNQGFDMYDDTLNSHRIYTNYEAEITAPLVYSKFRQWFDKNYHRKFFAWVHFYDPHKPYEAPKKYRERFKNDSVGRYDAEIAFTDEYVGKIIDALKSKNILENTVVIIVGDHGEAFGEHKEYGHGIFCYEETLKVPLIFYNPQLFPKPKRVKSRVTLADLMPTILELYGISLPTGIQGNSMVHLLAGKEAKILREFPFESMYGKDELNFAPLMGILNGHYKYISLPEPELYNLESDPGEKENLFRKQNRLAREMDKKLMRWVAESSGNGAGNRRQLTAEDKKQLKTLGYISSFTHQSSSSMDPKKGVELITESRQIFNRIRTGQLRGVEGDLEALILKFPGDAKTIYELKYRFYSKQGEREKTLNILKKAMEKFPKDEFFYVYFAIETFTAGQMEEAETACRKLLSMDTKYTRAYIILGEIEEKRGDISNALANYKNALEIEPHNISLQLKYADLLIIKKDFQKALTVYDDALKREEVSSDPGLLYKVALLNFQFGTLERSSQLLKRAIGFSPNGKYYFSYALVLAKSGKREEAMRNIKIALEKYSSDLTSQQVQVAEKAVRLWTPGSNNR